MTRLALSIVVPCYNEEACLPELHRRLSEAAHETVRASHEIVFVNDGSRDASWQVMQALAASDPQLVAVNLSRNHGHQLALTAGLDLAVGERILIIDADLQDPPELLPAMMREMDLAHADVVYGVRRSRGGETAFKRGTAKLFYRLLSRATDTEIPVDTGDFRLISRRALEVFLAMPEQARFIRGMVAWLGFRQVPLPYDRDERFAGTTNYPFRKMLRFALDALTSFSSTPLKLASHAGLLLSFGSVLLIIYIFAGWLSGRAVEGWTSLMLVVVALGAVQMFFLGVMGEYLGRLYSQAKQRPLYIVSDIRGARADRQARLGIDASAERPAPVEQESRHGSHEDVGQDGPPGRPAERLYE
jgi:dolichol-phosphate mannosyltransferase